MEVSIVRYYCNISDIIKNNKNLTKEEIDSLEEIENEYLKLKDKCFELMLMRNIIFGKTSINI